MSSSAPRDSSSNPPDGSLCKLIADARPGQNHDLPRDDARRVPNLVYTPGYVNSSWTLRSDMIARWVCRFLRHLRRRGYGSGTPSAKSVEQDKGFFPLNSGYMRRSLRLFPQQGTRDPWRIRQNYFLESILFRLAPLGRQMVHKTPRGARVSGESIHSGPVSV